VTRQAVHGVEVVEARLDGPGRLEAELVADLDARHRRQVLRHRNVHLAARVERHEQHAARGQPLPPELGEAEAGRHRIAVVEGPGDHGPGPISHDPAAQCQVSGP
jgi:hypothetical protein